MKIKKIALSNFLIFFISAMVIASIGAASVSALTGITSVRLWGADRYKTSVNISREGWESSRYVLLATGAGDDKFADALAGAPLAGALNAPVLLTESSSLSMDTKQEIARLKPEKVFILGGTGVISENVKSEIENMGITVERLSGNDRYGTAAEIAEALKLIKPFSKAVITTGSEFQYAMMIAPFAARDNLPVLFTMQDNIPDGTKDALKNLGINEIEIIGSYNIVSGSVEDKLREMDIVVKRISGDSISETNINVIKEHLLFPRYISIARDDLFADALSGVP